MSLRTVVALACLAALSITARAEGAADLKIHDFGRGAVAAYSTCTPQPNGDDLCEDFIVQYYVSPRGTGMGTAVLGHFMAFIHPDGTATEFVAEVGFADGVSGAYDISQLTFARMNGGTVNFYEFDPGTGDLIPNGRTATLGPFEWIAASGAYVFANDGPFGFGLPRHVVDSCATQIENAHERFTTARVTGSINGVSVDTLGPSYLPWPGTGPADALGAVFDNRIKIIVASHGPGC